MKNVKVEDKRRVMMIERTLRLEVSYHFTSGATFEGRDGPDEKSHGGNERKYEKDKSYRRPGSLN